MGKLASHPLLLIFLSLFLLGMGAGDKSIRINPFASIVFFNMGTAKYSQGYYASAINDFNAVLARKVGAGNAKRGWPRVFKGDVKERGRRYSPHNQG